MKRTDAELRAVSEHFHYEVSMLQETTRRLGSGNLADGPEKNAFLESFTIHARAILQAFWPTSPKPNDMLVKQFFDNPSAWKKQLGKPAAVLKKVNERVAREIVHVSFDRVGKGPEAKQWAVPEIHDALMDKVRLFIAEVPATRLSKAWAKPVGWYGPVVMVTRTFIGTNNAMGPMWVNTTTMPNSISANTLIGDK